MQLETFVIIHSAPQLLYLDPSAVSVTLTSVAAIAIALGAAIAIKFKMMKKKVADKLHLDENANKEVEEDLVINEETTEDQETVEASEE